MKDRANHDNGTLPWGNSFVSIPRRIYEWLFSDDLATSRKGKLALFLWGKCHYADSDITIKGGYVVRCKRGEYIASQLKIAQCLGLSKGIVDSTLEKLKKDGLIDVERVNVGDKTLCSRIRVVGYDNYNKPPSNSAKAKPKPYVKAPQEPHATPPARENGEAEMESFDEYVKRRKKEGRA